MVPKPIYELMPYLYLVTGGVIIAALVGYATPAGLLLYAYGTWLWLMRSDHRRVNQRQPAFIGTRFYWGENFYELQPFLYILAGLLVIGFVQHDIRWVTGPLMIVTGIAVLLLRTSKRRQPVQQVLIPMAKRPTRAMVGPQLPDSERLQLVVTDTAEGEAEQPKFHPATSNCDSCQIVDICRAVRLDIRSVQEVMRLSQTVSPDDAFELYREAVEKIEGRRLSDDELRAVLSLLYGYSDLCATWRKTGRLA